MPFTGLAVALEVFLYVMCSSLLALVLSIIGAIVGDLRIDSLLGFVSAYLAFYVIGLALCITTHAGPFYTNYFLVNTIGSAIAYTYLVISNRRGGTTKAN